MSRETCYDIILLSNIYEDTKVVKQIIAVEDPNCRLIVASPEWIAGFCYKKKLGTNTIMKKDENGRIMLHHRNSSGGFNLDLKEYEEFMVKTKLHWMFNNYGAFDTLDYFEEAKALTKALRNLTFWSINNKHSIEEEFEILFK